MKRSPVFYVITRNGRRSSEDNYWTITEARGAAARLRAMLRHWKDPDVGRVEIVKTAEPHLIH